MHLFNLVHVMRQQPIVVLAQDVSQILSLSGKKVVSMLIVVVIVKTMMINVRIDNDDGGDR